MGLGRERERKKMARELEREMEGGGGLGTDRVVLDVPLEKEELEQMAENLELCTERNR